MVNGNAFNSYICISPYITPSKSTAPAIGIYLATSPDEWMRARRYEERATIVTAQTQINILLFARMLFKIAHSYAVAAFGISGFHPIWRE